MKEIWFVAEPRKGNVRSPWLIFDQEMNEIPSADLTPLIRCDGKVFFCQSQGLGGAKTKILGYYEFENRTQIVDWLHLMRQGKTEEAETRFAKFKRDLVAIYKAWILGKGDRKC